MNEYFPVQSELRHCNDTTSTWKTAFLNVAGPKRHPPMNEEGNENVEKKFADKNDGR